MTKTEERHILYSSDLWDVYESFEEAKKDLADIIMDTKCYESEDEITDEDVFEQFRFDSEFNWDEFKRCFTAHCDRVDALNKQGGAFLIVASLGRWDGTFAGGKIVSDGEEILSAILDSVYNDICFEVEDGTIVMSGGHHDGSDSFTFYNITDKGMKWYGNNECALSDRELHEHLVNTKGYTRKLFTKIKDFWK